MLRFLLSFSSVFALVAAWMVCAQGHRREEWLYLYDGGTLIGASVFGAWLIAAWLSGRGRVRTFESTEVASGWPIGAGVTGGAISVIASLLLMGCLGEVINDAILICVASMLGARVVLRAKSEPPLSDGRCSSCGYNLEGLDGARCPECGLLQGSVASSAPESPQPV
jgi:hypothetical protein